MSDDIVELMAAIIAGLIVGSFLTVCVHRLGRGQSVCWPRSHCPACKRTLGVVDLVPVLSFVWFRGRCRTCQTRIGWVYPVVELAAVGLFVVAVVLHGVSLDAVRVVALGGVLIVGSVVDLQRRIIPNRLVAAGAVMGLLLLPWHPDWVGALIGAVGASGFLLVTAIISRGGMGGGDIKLVFVIGLFLGWQLVIVGLFLAFITGALVGLALMVTGKKGRKDFIPFGPFIAMGAMIAMLWGEQLLRWYLG